MRARTMGKKNAVFIHSLFRTGSTYVWSAFRRSGSFHCYYEPFHQELAHLRAEDLDRWRSTAATAATMRHPLLEKEYMEEYRHLLPPGRPGVPHFRKSFSFDDFCRAGRHPAQKRYIDFLLENTGGRMPLLQFNRSSLRAAWFKKNYPGAFHVYLLREPRRQFRSFLQVWEKENLDIFAVMNLLTAGINMKRCRVFRDLSRRLPLLEYHAAEFMLEEEFYRSLLPVYSIAEQYAVHFCIWFAALLENLVHADMLLDIDRLSGDNGYRAQASRRLEDASGAVLDFADARSSRTEALFLPGDELGGIENDVRAMLLRRVGRRRAGELADRLDSETMGADRPRRELWLEWRERSLPAIDIRQARIAKQEFLFRKYSPKVAELDDTIEASRIWLQIKRAQNSEEFEALARRHHALRTECRALQDLLQIPPGKPGLRPSAPQAVRSWFAKSGRGGSLTPASEVSGSRGGLRLAGVHKKSLPGSPLLTVVIVALNEVRALEQTILSVLGQTYGNIELIVIDGGSEQPTLEVIGRFADRIDYWLSEPDRGIFDAMNKGIALAGGEWINFLNCGDRFYRPDTVEAVFRLPTEHVDFIYGHSEFLGGDFRGVVRAWSFDILWKTMIFTHQSLFTRSGLLKARKFDTRFRICADFHLIFNAYRQGKGFLNSDLVIAAFDPGFSDVSRARMAWEKWLVVRRHRNDLRFHLFYLQLFLKRLLRDVIRRLHRRWEKVNVHEA
jgi:hypothetical protein